MKLGIELVQTTTLKGCLTFSVYHNQKRKSYEIVDRWDRAEKFWINIHFRGVDHRVEYILVPEAFLSYIIPGEVFGIKSHGMILVAAEIARDRPRWIPYVVSKLFLQEYVDEGLDKTGLVKHYAGLMMTIRMAGMKMSKDELVEFLEKMVRHERTSYYELDQEVRQFLDDAKNSCDRREKRLEYLGRHHKNFWVRFGRQNEDLDAFGIDPGGFRNIAEAAYRSIDSDVAVMFTAAILVRQIADLPTGAQILVPREYIKISYALTEQGSCGRVELLRLVEAREDGDLVEKVGPRRSWFALVKRLSWAIYQTEEKVDRLIEDRRQKLNATIRLGHDRASELHREIAVLHERVAGQGQKFDEAADRLRQLTGWQEEIKGLSDLSEATSLTIVELTALKAKLAEVV